MAPADTSSDSGEPWNRVCRTFTYLHLDASLLALWKYYSLHGLNGLWNAMPRPTPDAWMHIAAFGAIQAALQLLLPGKEHNGPVTPNGNVPVYKVRQGPGDSPETAMRMRNRHAHGE